jgi:PPP family 3-phenylpropionic acid transporter
MGSLGSLHPYLALALADAGADAATIPLIVAAFPIARLTAGPLSGWIADRYARPDLVLQVSALTAGVSALALGAAPNWVMMGASVYALAFCRVPLFPLIDVQIVRTSGGYGPVRVWGSVGFVLAVLGVGLYVDALPRLSAAVAGGALLATGLLALTLPKGGPSTRDPLFPAMKRLLAIPALRPLWLLSALHAATLSTYDHLFSLHVAALGLSAKVTSAGVAAGVGMEILVLAAGPRLLRRLGPAKLILIAVVVTIPRWLITGTTSDPVLLAGIQTLHGVGFGCWWIGGIGLLAERAPEDLRNSAQSLFVWSAYGVGTLAAMGLSAVMLSAMDSSRLFLALSVVSAAAVVATTPLLRR